MHTGFLCRGRGVGCSHCLLWQIFLFDSWAQVFDPLHRCLVDAGSDGRGYWAQHLWSHQRRGRSHHLVLDWWLPWAGCCRGLAHLPPSWHHLHGTCGLIHSLSYIKHKQTSKTPADSTVLLQLCEALGIQVRKARKTGAIRVMAGGGGACVCGGGLRKSRC